jgi:aspartyl-tRNA(Asn)/glutamyl-tRNA(Gln) amidotransferase subunit A
MADELHFLTIAEASRLIETKKLSPVEYVDALLARIEALNPVLDAFLLITGDQAREDAKKAEAEIAGGNYKGPLHGIPFALKDIYETKGIRTTAHSKILIDNVPDKDATSVSNLKKAGAILLGKLATHEFAHGGPSLDLPWPPARNPWKLDRFTGGSSSGSGAGVAAGLFPLATGSDTGGSIRGPAGLCGIAGLKPTYGLVSRAGVIPNSYSYDHAGPMAWTAEDCAIGLQGMASYDPGRDPASAKVIYPDYRAALNGKIDGLRVGVIRHFYEEESAFPDAAIKGMNEAIAVFESLGAKVSDVRVRPLQDYRVVKLTMGEAEIFSVNYPDLVKRPGDFGHDFRSRTIPACLLSGVDYMQASRLRRRMMVEMEEVYKNYDVLITAGQGPAPEFPAYKSISNWTGGKASVHFNVVCGPSISVCNGFDGDGMPISVMISGKPFSEPVVLNAAHAFEKATAWRKRRPSLSADMEKPPTGEIPVIPDIAGVDDATKSRAAAAVEGAGLTLDELMLDEVYEAAPYIYEMSARLRQDLMRCEEPSSIMVAQPAKG